MSNFVGKGTTFLRHVQIIVKKSHRVSRRSGLVLMLNTSQPYFYHNENNYQCNEDI